ncbi:hypothetical protein L7F22_056800 [Adiantum nelumboides]|nr:hypothetical protein [Adiantum nelumboides]
MAVAAASFSLQAQAFGDGESMLRPAARHRVAAHSRVCAYRITREAKQQAKSSMIILKRDMKLIMTQERIEMFESLEGWAEDNVLPYLKSVDWSWQPQDFLPDPSGDTFEEECFINQLKHMSDTGRQTQEDPYLGFIYTSFQERATFISHGNTARQAKQFGDVKLAQICGIIASDEKRHENAYQKIVEKLIELDPNGTILCLENMMRKRISMPACLMYDGCDENLYEKFSLVTQRTGVYTARDYADILDYLIRRWKVDKLVGLSSRGQQAQEYVCALAARVRKVEERSRMLDMHCKTPLTASFSWIFTSKQS